MVNSLEPIKSLDLEHQGGGEVGPNFFSGHTLPSPRYTQFKWRVVSQFNNALDFDAMTLGNHEVKMIMMITICLIPLL